MRDRVDIIAVREVRLLESQAHSMGWKLRKDIQEIKTKRGVVKLKQGHIFVEAMGEKDPVLNLPWKYKYKQCYIVTQQDHDRDCGNQPFIA